MSVLRPALERRIALALEQLPPRVPVLVGGCGCGRTTLLRRLAADGRHEPSVYLDVERSATTPERFFDAVAGAGARIWPGAIHPVSTAREAYDATLALLRDVTGPAGRPVTFLFDEVLEIKTFESFPGLRGVLPELVRVLAASRNHFVLATRFTARARRLLAGDATPSVVVPIPQLTPAEVGEHLGDSEPSCRALAPVVHALSDGRPAYSQALCEQLIAMGHAGGGDPVSALAALFAPGGRLAARCEASYEMRLHHARGKGSLKAILQILAEEQPLTLTAIALRLRRTPGSTKDYLSWLEDVDLVAADHKRYAIVDPLLRLWVRLYCRPVPPAEDAVAREAQAYALTRLAPADTRGGPVPSGRLRPWEIPDPATGRSA